jgi:hypothetical protein
LKKLTKQGVRNLDILPGKSAGRKLDAIPQDAQVCEHKNIKQNFLHGFTYCADCSFQWDDWRPR